MPQTDHTGLSVQCKRYSKFTAADGKAAVVEAVAKAADPPDVMLLVVGCDVSLAARTAYERAAFAAGIGSAKLWTASKLEVMLYTDHPDLLFSYFGVSLARRERSHETNLRCTLAMERKLTKLFPHGHRNPRIIVRFIDDKSYPDSETPPQAPSAHGFRVEFAGHYHVGVEVYLNIQHIIVDRNDGTWSPITYVEKGIDVATRPEEVFANTRYNVVKVFTVGHIPFRNIFEVDEDGDEYYSESHLYCRFADDGMPHEIILQREVDGYAEFHPDARFPFSAWDSRCLKTFRTVSRDGLSARAFEDVCP